MLTVRELATIRAALAFWRDEMTPHGLEAMEPYLDERMEVPLGESELATLLRQFTLGGVRVARFDPPDRLTLLSPSEAAAATHDARTVTVLGDLD